MVSTVRMCSLALCCAPVVLSDPLIVKTGFSDGEEMIVAKEDGVFRPIVEQEKIAAIEDIFAKAFLEKRSGWIPGEAQVATTCAEVSALPGLGCCADAKDCSPYSAADKKKIQFSTWDWKSQGCKMKNKDVCTLWQGCVGEQNLAKGAHLYWTVPMIDMNYDYCVKEHCGNQVFTLATTPIEAEWYCDQKFGQVWRFCTPETCGGAGSGIWECAHRNYQCDWAYCKLGICDKLARGESEADIRAAIPPLLE